MVKRLLFLASFLISTSLGYSQSLKNTTVSLITFSPGAELYSLFGHSAIRINNPLTGDDRVYNFGTFDFGTPNFGLKFTSGRLDYMLAVNSYSEVYQNYLWEQREMSEQILNLDNAQKAKIIELLETNYLPENRFYRYDFLNDNCATRLRDIIEKATGDSSLFSRAQTSYSKLTYRQLLRQFLTDYPWVDLGIDLAIGLPGDKVTNNREKMFLPEYLRQVVAVSKLSNGETLVSESRPLLTDIREKFDSINFLTPLSIFFALLTLSLLGFSSRQFSRAFAGLFYFALGLLGIILTLTTFATDHAAMKGNLNLLWALPFHIVMFRAAAKRSISKFARYYFIGTGIIALYLLASWGRFPQEFNKAIIPILIAIVVTSVQICFHRYSPVIAKQTKKEKKASSV